MTANSLSLYLDQCNQGYCGLAISLESCHTFQMNSSSPNILLKKKKKKKSVNKKIEIILK